MKTPLRARVNVTVTRFDAHTGRILDRRTKHNLVVEDGLQRLRDFIYGDTVSGLAECAIGTNGTPPSSTDGTLGNEVFRGGFAQRQKVGNTVVFRFAVSSQEANGNTIREAGLFTEDGYMYARVTPEEYVKTISEAVLYTWTVSFEAES